MKWLLAALLFLPLTAITASSLDQIPFKTTDGKDASLKDDAGKVILIVNVASLCGNTPQYVALEQLYRQYGSQVSLFSVFPAMTLDLRNPEAMRRSRHSALPNTK
jgi:glutathione peroxidase